MKTAKATALKYLLRPALLAAVLSLLAGCLAFKTGNGRAEMVDKDWFQHQAIRVSGVEPRITRSLVYQNEVHYKLELEAIGDFIVHHGDDVYTDVQTMVNIGFFPGYGYGGLDTLNVLDASLGMIIVNVGLGGIPTIGTLLFEPFSDYKTSKDASITAMGLIGCYKGYDRDSIASSRKEFRVTKSERVSSVKLFGWTVEINGKTYKSDNGVTTSKSSIYFTGTPGSRVRIRIVSAPYLRGDSKDALADFTGVVLEGVCP